VRIDYEKRGYEKEGRGILLLKEKISKKNRQERKKSTGCTPTVSGSLKS
jgi:hypothetical protein